MSTKTRVRGHVLRTEPYEDITWNQKRFPKPRFFRALATLRWAAQFLFCKLIEHQTEGGFWFSMLR